MKAKIERDYKNALNKLTLDKYSPIFFRNNFKIRNFSLHYLTPLL